MKRARCLVAVAAVLALVAAPSAHAAQRTTAEPSLTTTAYYWEDAQRQEHQTPNGTVVVETPPPFCPATLPGSLGAAEEVCASEILPVWIQRGDYETPYMLSAAAFDLSLIPVGSKVHSFTATFLEDESGCYDHDGKQQTPPRCRSTDPINVEGKELQACLLGQIIGGGDARPYREVPNHICSPADPIAKRKEIKNNDKKDPQDNDPDHVWTFDLTSFAREWVKEFSVVTGIVITARTPKDTGDNRDTWRVVLSGPSREDGVKTNLVYTPAELPTEGFPPVGGPTGTTGFPSTFGGDAGSFTTTTGGATDFGSTPIGTETSTAPADEGEPTAPVAAPGQNPTSEQVPIEAMPGYVWLAILAGLVAFSLVRSVVLERAVGIRPNGALAQIRRLNAARRGGELAAASPALSGFGRAAGAVGQRIAAGAAKLRSVVTRR